MLSTEAWMLEGLARSTPARLQLAGERLSLWSADQLLFDVPVEAVESVHTPWYYFGGGLHLTIDGQRYRLSFVVPTAEQGGITDIPKGRAMCKLWVETLLPLRRNQ